MYIYKQLYIHTYDNRLMKGILLYREQAMKMSGTHQPSLNSKDLFPQFGFRLQQLCFPAWARSDNISNQQYPSTNYKYVPQQINNRDGLAPLASASAPHFFQLQAMH